MRYTIALIFLLIGFAGTAQITLQQQNSDKTVNLKAGGEVILHMNLPGPSFTTSSRQVSGFLVGQKPSLIQLDWQSETKSYTLNTGMRKSEMIDYTTIPDLPATSFSMDEINAIQYRGANAGKWNKIGKILTYAGLVNALVVSPLISTDFENKSFNRHRYWQYTGASLVASGIGVTIMLGSRYKTYATQANGRKKEGQPLWQL